MSSNVTVHPDTYFRDHAATNTAPRNGREFGVKLIEPLETWIEFAQSDVPGGDRTKLDIASLAVMFGADRPLVSWGYPVRRFGEISHEVKRRQMEGELTRSLDFGPMDTRTEYKVAEYPQTIRVDQNTMDLIDQYERILRTKRSVVVRHLMAVSFQWYNKDVFDRNQFEQYSELLDPYVERFRRELDARIRFANEQLDMNVRQP